MGLLDEHMVGLRRKNQGEHAELQLDSGGISSEPVKGN
jgi:hypothetical protein